MGALGRGFGHLGALGGVGAYAQLINTLRSSTVWSKLSALYVFAVPTQAAAVQNLINPGTLDLTATNSPTFTANQGFTGDGVSMHLIGSAFSSITGYTTNSHSAGVFSLNTQKTSAIGIMATDTSSQAFGIASADNSRQGLSRSATTTNDAIPAANSGICHMAFSRSSAGSYSQYTDRMKSTASTASVSIPGSAKLTFLRASTTYTLNKVGAAWIGAAITDAEYALLDNALATYLRRVGAYSQPRGIDGAWTWFNDPRVASVNGVPAVAAVTSNGTTAVMRDNASTGLNDRSILHNILLADDHCNPGIIVRATDSKILTGYNKHNDPAFYTRISSSSNDVSAFGSEVDISAQLGVGGGTNNFAYANFVELTGDAATGGATNLAFYSNQINGTSAHWTIDNVSVTGSQSDPFGGTNASLLTGNGASATHRVISSDSTAFTSGQSYASSIFVKPGTQQYVQLTFASAAFGTTKYATFDLTGLAVVAGSTQNCTAYMYPVGGGYYRLVAVATATASASGNSCVFCLTDGSNSRSPTITTSGTITVVQAQVEQGTAATPPITTAGATASRAATTDVLWAFFRGTTSAVWTLHYSTTIDGGDTTWTPATRMLWDGRPYWKAKANGTGRIDFICNDQNPGDATYAYCNTYHFYYQNGAFFKSDGTSAGSLPLLQTGPTKIYDSQASGFDSWVWDLVIDSSNRPVASFAVFPTTSDHRYHQARWNGSAWVDNEVCAAGGYIYAGQPQYSGGIVTDPTNINTVYCSRQVNSSGVAVSSGGTFQLFKYVTADGGTTWTGTQLTFGSLHCIRPYIADGIRNLYYVCGTYTSYTVYQTTIEHIAI